MLRLLPPALRSGLLPRLLFLFALGGGLLWWSELRRPRDLQLSVDLTGALPGDIREIDVVVRRGGHALARHDVSYGGSGAPATLEVIVHAPPGEVEVETTLGYGARPSRRSLSWVDLAPDRQAQVRAR